MHRTKKFFFVVVVAALVIGGVWITYNMVKGPEVIPKLGGYCMSEVGLTASFSSTYNDSAPGDINLETKETCRILGQQKNYVVKHSLIHGDVIVIDWLKGKQVKLKVLSDHSLQALEDCGTVIPKGTVLLLDQEPES